MAAILFRPQCVRRRVYVPPEAQHIANDKLPPSSWSKALLLWDPEVFLDKAKWLN